MSGYDPVYLIRSRAMHLRQNVSKARFCDNAQDLTLTQLLHWSNIHHDFQLLHFHLRLSCCEWKDTSSWWANGKSIGGEFQGQASDFCYIITTTPDYVYMPCCLFTRRHGHMVPAVVWTQFHCAKYFISSYLVIVAVSALFTPFTHEPDWPRRASRLFHQPKSYFTRNIHIQTLPADDELLISIPSGCSAILKSWAVSGWPKPFLSERGMERHSLGLL